MDFGIGSDEIKIENSALLISMLEEDPKRVQALFAEEPQDIFDENTQSNRDFQDCPTILMILSKIFSQVRTVPVEKVHIKLISIALILKMTELMTKWNN